MIKTGWMQALPAEFMLFAMISVKFATNLECGLC